MNEATQARIRAVKDGIEQMLAERETLAGGDGRRANPSVYWSSFCARFRYMLGMPDDAFEDLRVHTYHLTRDVYLTYYDDDVDSEAFRRRHAELIEDIPGRLRIFEDPQIGIGFPVEGGRFSHDFVRFQTVINALYRAGILDRLKDRQLERNLALEIGAGYGALGHHVQRLTGVSYIIVDLPETLLFSATYLTQVAPDKRVYLYSPATFSKFIQQPHDWDFALIPNYRLEDLGRLEFALAVNIASFQEMRGDQVAAYVEFIARTCRGHFYSWNQDAHPKNLEIASVSQLLQARFTVEELGMGADDDTRGRYKRLLKNGKGVSARRVREATAQALRAAAWRLHPPTGKPVPPYRQLLCRPKVQRPSA